MPFLEFNPMRGRAPDATFPALPRILVVGGFPCKTKVDDDVCKATLRKAKLLLDSVNRIHQCALASAGY